jgi:hypothetical protein
MCSKVEVNALNASTQVSIAKYQNVGLDLGCFSKKGLLAILPGGGY